jgi:predicted SnoaL-like aldol condensation-catalyzing enzyme
MNKDIAVSFLKSVIAVDIDDAYDKYIDKSGKHHNVYTLAGFSNLRKGMQEADDQSPDMIYEPKNVFGDGDLVAVHGHLTMSKGDAGMTTVHMFRFENGKIVELWDVAQDIPADSVNIDGAF